MPPRDAARSEHHRAAEPAAASPIGETSLLAEIDLLRSTVRSLRAELDGLQRAMASRAVIDQAKGAIRAVCGVGGDEAFALLASRSQNSNRKLTVVASEVLASLEPLAAPDRVAGLLEAVRQPEARPAADPAGPGWRGRHRPDSLGSAVTDREQLLALAHLGERLAGVRDGEELLGVLLQDGAEALGAYAAAVSRLVAPGRLATTVGGADTDVLGAAEGTGQVAVDGSDPVAECVRSGRPLVLSRADLALRYPRHPRPERLRGLVLLPLAASTPAPMAWSLFLDQPVPADRGVRAMLERAARMVTATVVRIEDDPVTAATLPSE